MAFVARLAAAADVPMRQAKRSVCSAATPQGAAALCSRERDASGWRSRGLRAYGSRGGPLEGAGEVVHQKAVTVQWPHASRRTQAPDPRVAAVRRQAY